MDFGRAIPTMYNGVRFRSRFEASTALMLDTMGLSWQYEPISYLLGSGTHYRPDFWIPDQKLWLESRGYVNTQGERQIRGFGKWIQEGRVALDGSLRTPTTSEWENGPQNVQNEYEDDDCPSYMVLRDGAPDWYGYMSYFGTGEHWIGPAVLYLCWGCQRYFFGPMMHEDGCVFCGRKERSNLFRDIINCRSGTIMFASVGIGYWRTLQDWIETNSRQAR